MEHDASAMLVNRTVEAGSFVDALLQETEKEIERATEEFSMPLPGQGAKADVLFNAIGVFASKGIADTTVQDLLDAANISRRTF